MKSKMWIVVVLLLAVALASTACGPGGGATPQQGGEAATSVPAATKVADTPPAESATATPQQEAAATEEPPALEVDTAGLEGLNSYRVRISTQWTPESGDPERFVSEHEYTREPLAQRMYIESDQGTVEWVQIGDTAWFCSGGTCAQSQQSADDIASSFGSLDLDPDSFVVGSDYRYVGQETINGVRTRHYILNLDAATVAILAQGEVSDVQCDVWVADDSSLPDFVVRYMQSWKEKRGDQLGVSEFGYEVYDVNAPITIEPPEGAVGMPEDVPVYPGAQELFVMEQMISFSTPDEVAQVVEFYDTELAAQGWTKASEQDLQGLIMSSWSKDDRGLDLMISPAEDGGSSVVITLN